MRGERDQSGFCNSWRPWRPGILGACVFRTAFRPSLLVIAILGACCSQAHARSYAGPYLNRPDDWFRSEEGKRITANILSYQSDAGSWPKNTDTVSAPYTGDRAKLSGTFDNDATTDELRFLAHAWR